MQEASFPSKDKATQAFIEKTKLQDPEKYKILVKLRKIIHENYNSVTEKTMYGGILFSLSEDIGGLFVHKHHVTLAFSFGYLFNDPNQLLEGDGKYRRHLRIVTLDDIANKRVDFFVKQIGELEI
jgi:hypothetical protein